MTRIYPSCDESERTLLGGLILDPRRMDEVAGIVRSSDFHRDDHGRLFGLLGEMRSTNTHIDLVTISDRIQRENKAGSFGGVAYVVSLTREVPATSNLAHYAGVVAEKAVLRRWIEKAEEHTRTAYSQPADVGTFLGLATRELGHIADGGTPQGWSTVAQVLETMGDAEDVAGQALPTPWYALNEVLHGFYPSDLLILAARPAMGKTALALNLARNAAQWCDVGIFSLEMSKPQLTGRLLCDIGSIDAGKMRKGKLDEYEKRARDEAARMLAGMPIHIDDTGNVTLVELRAKAMALAARVPNLGLIVVDYLQIMKGDPTIRNREQQISDISRGLKAIAKDLNVPVLALSQLNRGVESRQDKRPMVSDLRESGAIEQDADVIMFIYRDDYYNPYDSEFPGQAEVIVAKHRAGRCDTARLRFDGRYVRFTDLDAIALD